MRWIVALRWDGNIASNASVTWSWRGERRDRGGTHGERARLTVTKGLGTALARIAAQHPALGARLSATVRPGWFCVYVPDPRQPIRWESY